MTERLWVCYVCYRTPNRTSPMRHLARHLAALFVVLYALSAQARETWHEAHSPHFDLVSNANEKSARAVLARMEQFRRALGRVLPNQKLVGEVATQIYAFRDFESFSSFLPRTRDGVTEAAGYFRRGPYKNIIAIDLSAGPGAYERVVFHEYVHFILSFTTRTHPLWFQEGMAEFYAGMRLRGDGIVVGGGVLRHRRVLFENAMLPLEELLTAGAQRPLSSSPSENAVFYAQSWALVHYLIVDRGEEGHRHLAHYLSALSRGEEVLEAFQAAFGVNAETLEDALRAYVEAGKFTTLRYTVAETDWKEDIAVRTLKMAEVQHRWGELFLFTGRSKEALMCLEEAIRLDPGLARAWETLGVAQLMKGRPGSAIPFLKRAVDAEDASPMGLYQYARALLRDHSGHGVVSIPDALADEAERALTRSWQLDPTRSETARLLAFVYLVRGTRLQEATNLVESALDITPRSPPLLFLYGQILARRGEYDGARRALRSVRDAAAEPVLRDAATELLSRMNANEKVPD